MSCTCSPRRSEGAIGTRIRHGWRCPPRTKYSYLDTATAGSWRMDLLHLPEPALSSPINSISPLGTSGIAQCHQVSHGAPSRPLILVHVAPAAFQKQTHSPWPGRGMARHDITIHNIMTTGHTVFVCILLRLMCHLGSGSSIVNDGGRVRVLETPREASSSTKPQVARDMAIRVADIYLVVEDPHRAC